MQFRFFHICGKVIFTLIARQIQKHLRLFQVLETTDNGKPIRETRDIDIPLVARHFFTIMRVGRSYRKARCLTTNRSV
jgi:acyl-CoA reductase-like NAD-dependent aldehyde dehydrogenase